MIKLNLGSGSNKIEGCINIDAESSCNPDLVVDFLKGPLPYEDDSIDEVYLFHTIEHIQKRFHGLVLNQIHRVLKSEGRLLVSFPEFRKCYKNWEINKGGQKQFWEATIFGRQLYPSDHHVCIMDGVDFHNVMNEIGFKNVTIRPEPEPNEFNTIVCGFKGLKMRKYEDVLKEDIENLVIHV